MTTIIFLGLLMWAFAECALGGAIEKPDHWRNQCYLILFVIVVVVALMLLDGIIPFRGR